MLLEGLCKAGCRDRKYLASATGAQIGRTFLSTAGVVFYLPYDFHNQVKSESRLVSIVNQLAIDLSYHGELLS